MLRSVFRVWLLLMGVFLIFVGLLTWVASAFQPPRTLSADELAALRARFGAKQTAERPPAPPAPVRFTVSDATLLGEGLQVRVLTDHTQRTCALVLSRSDLLTAIPWPCDPVLR